jgi:hypothetical protein
LTDPAALANAPGGQKLPVIVPDGAGGAIVAWLDERNNLLGSDVFAQHVLASGAVDAAWPANGVALCTARGVQDNLAIVSDGAGGAIVTWMDGRAGGGASGSGVDIYAQHVLATGRADPGWTADGVALCTAPSTQAFPEIASDGSHGAIVTWFDFRLAANGSDIYAQHVSSTGVVDVAWPVNGRALCLAPQDQSDPTIVSDGVHGAIVTWDDLRDGTRHIFAQRVLGSGAIAPGWPVDGRALCTAPIEQIMPHITSDGAGGAIVTWKDLRNGENHNPFAQHVLASGTIDPGWPVNGRALSLSSFEELEAAIVEDGAGGAIVAWEEASFVMAQHVLASGFLDPAFPVNGRFVRLLLTFQQRPDLTTAGPGTAIVAWADGLSGDNHDIYANLVTTSVTAAVDPGQASAIRFAPPSPNPARGSLTLRFTLPREAPVRLAIYDVGGRRVRDLLSGPQPAGERSVAWDLRDEAGQAVRSGLYFLRLEAEGRTFTHTLVALK